MLLCWCAIMRGGSVQLVYGIQITQLIILFMLILRAAEYRPEACIHLHLYMLDEQRVQSERTKRVELALLRCGCEFVHLQDRWSVLFMRYNPHLFSAKSSEIHKPKNVVRIFPLFDANSVHNNYNFYRSLCADYVILITCNICMSWLMVVCALWYSWWFGLVFSDIG